MSTERRQHQQLAGIVAAHCGCCEN